MLIINENPFRILGLPANSSEREIQKQIALIKRYSEIGKTPVTNFDMNYLGDFIRDKDNLSHAVSIIEQDNSKLLYALLWYVDYNEIDKKCISLLNDGNINMAISIWEENTNEGINENNFSHFNNLSTLYLSIPDYNNLPYPESLKKGMDLKFKLMDSDYFRFFVEFINGYQYSYNVKELMSKFSDIILNNLIKTAQLDYKQLTGIFESCPENIRENVISSLISEPASKIEKIIGQTESKRKENPHKANEEAKNLFLVAKPLIMDINNILDVNNAKRQQIINNVSEELLQCSIDYYNYYLDEGSIDPGDEALKIVQLAKSVKPTSMVRKRIEENLPVIEEWVKGKEERDNILKVKCHFENISSRIDIILGMENPSLNNVEQLVKFTNSELKIIASKLGVFNKTYREYSDHVAGLSQHIVVTIANAQQIMLTNLMESYISNNQKIIALQTSIDTFKQAHRVLTKISLFQLEKELSEQVNNNKMGINNTIYQLEGIIYKITNQGGKKSVFEKFINKIFG